MTTGARVGSVEIVADEMDVLQASEDGDRRKIEAAGGDPHLRVL